MQPMLRSLGLFGLWSKTLWRSRSRYHRKRFSHLPTLPLNLAQTINGRGFKIHFRRNSMFLFASLILQGDNKSGLDSLVVGSHREEEQTA